jgi:signal transduction histidine kinase
LGEHWHGTAEECGTHMTATSLESSFQRELIDSVDWDDLAQVIVRYPSKIVAADKVYLFVRNPMEPGLSYSAHWSKDRSALTRQLPDQFVSHCQRCLGASKYRDMVIDSCSMLCESREDPSVAGYCAPLVAGSETVAILLILLPVYGGLTTEQIEALTRVLPDMSLAIASFQLRRSVRLLADQAESSRQQFAQDLHDSLAHTIGYLRLKLDQLSMEGAQLEHEESRAQIECMRDAADEAYELIRHTLADLEPACPKDLAAMISNQANVIGQRGGFEVRITSSCEPIPIASEIQRQILYICREALNNTGRHAQAKCVDIHLQWGKDCFTLCISDDGIGFDIGEAPSGDHFGLAIMKQRAQSVGGTLTIRSAPGKGTQIFLWSPTAFTREGPR